MIRRLIDLNDVISVILRSTIEFILSPTPKVVGQNSFVALAINTYRGTIEIELDLGSRLV